MAAAATYSWTTDGYLSVSTIILPPQTTTFTPPPACSASASIWCSVTAADMSIVSECFLWDIVNATNNIPANDACYPGQGYGEIWYRDQTWSEDPQTRTFVCQRITETNSKTLGDISTLAYPGSACLSGWTTACTKTIVVSPGQYDTQTWCCPSNFVCNDQSGRDCSSILSTPTSLWVNDACAASACLSSSNGKQILFDQYDFSPSAGRAPITVYHELFPLSAAASVPTASMTSNAAGGSISTAASTAVSSGTHSGLAPAAAAGIGVGVAIGVILLLGGVGLFWFLRRRRRADVPAPAPAPVQVNVEAGGSGKPELSGDGAVQKVSAKQTESHLVELSAQRAMYPAEYAELEAREGS